MIVGSDEELESWKAAFLRAGVYPEVIFRNQEREYNAYFSRRVPSVLFKTMMRWTEQLLELILNWNDR